MLFRSVQVRTTANGKGISLRVIALGASARIPEDLQTALRPGLPLSELTPKAVPIYLAARLAEQAGAKLSVQGGSADRVEFAADIRPAG